MICRKSVLLQCNNLLAWAFQLGYCAPQHKRREVNHVADSKSIKAAPKAAAPKVAQPAAVPVAEPAVASAAKPAVVKAIAPNPVAAAAATTVNTVQKEAKTMNETVTKFVEDAKTRTEAAVGDFQNRAKAAVEKGQAGLADVAEFSKGNVEAMVASAKVAAKGAQDIAAYTVEYGKGAIEKAVADTKRLYSVKTPAEFFSVQSEITKANVDEAVAQVSKFTENYLKLVGEIVQPLSNRYALAAEKVKTAVAA
jgi:phasin family protein